jgi:hypothetical protein
MKALNFLRSLLPNFAKQTVLEDIRTTRLVLTAITVPSYESSMRLFGSRKLANPGLLKDWEVYRRNVKGANGANTIAAIEKTLKPMLATLDLIEKLVEKDYSDDIEGAGITYYKAAVLQMLESVSFASDFALRYLNYVTVVESAEIRLDDDEEEADDAATILTPAEVRYVSDRFLDFCAVMDTLSKPSDKLRTDFEAIPDVVITASGDQVVSNSIGLSKLDPFRHGVVPLFMNPIYHVRMAVAEWQHLRYEKAKAEKEALELRRLRMERLLQGKKDPSIEKQLEHNQKRIEDLSALLRKTEEQYA